MNFSIEEITIGCATLLTMLVTRYLPIIKTWWSYYKENRIGANLLVLYFISLVFTVGQRSTGDFIDNTRYIRVSIIAILAAISIFGIIISSKQRRIPNTGLTWYLIYALLAMSTAIYSLNPVLTIWKSTEIITGILVAIYISRNLVKLEQGQSLLNFIWLFHLFLVISALWGWVIYPAQASSYFTAYESQGSSDIFTYGIHGLFPKINPNTLTQVSATLLFVLLSQYIRKLATPEKIVVNGLAFISVVVMLLAHSRTSLFSLVICLTLFALFTRSKAGKVMFALVATLVVLSLPVVLNYVLRGQTESQFTSLTGRLEIWHSFYEKIMESPIIGYGFYSASKEIFNIPGADNTYLTVLLGGGIILTVVFCVPVLITMIKILQTRPRRLGRKLVPAYSIFWLQVAALFVFVFVRSVTGPSFDAHHIGVLFYLTCLISANMLRFAAKEVRIS